MRERIGLALVIVGVPILEIGCKIGGLKCRHWTTDDSIVVRVTHSKWGER